MGKFISNKALWVVLLLCWLMFVPAILIMPRQDLFEFMNAVCMGGATGIAICYGPAAWKALRLPPHDLTRGQVLVVGLVVFCIGVAGVFAGQWVWRSLDKPDWIGDSAILAFTRWVLASGMILVLSTSWTGDENVQSASFRKAGVVVAVCVACAAALIVFGLG